jgi:hypothetical protein
MRTGRDPGFALLAWHWQDPEAIEPALVGGRDGGRGNFEHAR